MISIIKGCIDFRLILSVFLVKVAENLRGLLYLLIFENFWFLDFTLIAFGSDSFCLDCLDCLFYIRLLQKRLYLFYICNWLCFVISVKEWLNVRFLFNLTLVVIILYHDLLAFFA